MFYIGRHACIRQRIGGTLRMQAAAWSAQVPYPFGEHAVPVDDSETGAPYPEIPGGDNA